MFAYDMADEIGRFISRSDAPRDARPRSSGSARPAQERLFEPSPAQQSVALAPTRSRRELVPDDDMLWSRVVSAHSAEKAFYVRRYAAMVGTGMRFRWPGKLWWIELFAGPGQLLVKDTDEWLPGSPVEAVSIPHPFTGYVFADLNQDCIESLRERVGGPNVHVRCADANSNELLTWIEGLVPRDALVVLYGDPEGLDLRWPTIERLIRRYRHLDLLLNLPVAGAVRALGAGYDGKAGAVLDHPAPLELLSRPALSKGASVRDWYWRRLEAEGYDHIDAVPVKIQSRNRDLYDIMIASRSPKAVEFFRKATALGPAGQYTLPV